MYELNYSAEALEDLIYILQYTFETFGEKQMNIYYNKIEKSLDSLKTMPTIGHSRKDIPFETLAYNVEKHTIIYEIVEDKKLVQILRILHSKMDFDEVW